MRKIVLVSCFLVSLVAMAARAGNNDKEQQCHDDEYELCVAECEYLLGTGDPFPFYICMTQCLTRSTRSDCI